jgi:hypothetical protein
MSSLRTVERIEDSSDGESVRGVSASGPRNGRSLESEMVSSSSYFWEIDPVTDLKEQDLPIEGASGTEGVCSHFAPGEPITHFQSLWKLDHRPDTIDRIASRAPDGCLFIVLVA